MDFLNNFYQIFNLNPTAQLPPASELYIVMFALRGVVAFVGTLVILIGVAISAYQYCYLKLLPERAKKKHWDIQLIRRNLGLTIVLGLEFIIAADVISTTMAPDYYSVGVLAIVVIIRTFLSYSLSREINALSPQQKRNIRSAE